ncbi:hypothetical protein V1525DRAFT_402581 [Lipomyces kononenkoae]|uniref:Uncharacterized protein n=1 Tax=Lipomyces kononenkoae TaxID=34357 RepID=A0ACC3T255_LIPKO
MHPFIAEITEAEEKMLRERGVCESFGVVASPDDFDMDTQEYRYSTMSVDSGGGGSLGHNMSVDTLMAQVDENGVEYGFDNSDNYDDLGIGDSVILLDDNAEMWRADRLGGDVSEDVVPTTSNLSPGVSSQGQRSGQQHAGSVVQAPLVSYYHHPEFQSQYSRQDALHYDAWKSGMQGLTVCPFSQEAQVARLDYTGKRKRRKSSLQGEGIQKIRVDHDGLDRSYREGRMHDH